MPRKPTHRIRMRLLLDEDLHARLETLLLDPRKGRMGYGLFSDLINKIIRQWLATLDKPGVDPIALLRAYGIELEKHNVADKLR